MTGALIPLNSTMLAVALRTIADDLHVGRGRAAVLVTAYLVAMLVCQPVAGRIGDRFGTRRVLAVATVGFGIASVGAAFSPTFAVLLVGRCAQALFGAALSPNTQALLRATVAPGRRGRTFGIVGTGVGVGAALGPVLGGFLADSVGWRGIFAVNLPLAALALALLARTSAKRGVAEAVADERPRRLSLELLGSRSFRASCITQATSNYALYTVLLVLPLLLADKGWAGAGVGLATSGLTVGMLVLGPLGGLLGDRRRRTVPILLGLAVLFVGCVILALGTARTALVVGGPLVMGVGMGLSGASLQAAALESVRQEVSGSAAGLFSASRYVGSITASVAISATDVSGIADAHPVLVATVVATALAVVAGRRIDPRVGTIDPGTTSATIES
ncbi:MAG TPA: MFS transporter [Acidimicrobiales bacterium]|nr:MFS transporter [Acidimicrobiales bacterium]